MGGRVAVRARLYRKRLCTGFGMSPLLLRARRAVLSGLWVVALCLIALGATGCVSTDNDLDTVRDDFFFGCRTTSDCGGDGYVCCYDKLQPSDPQCEGRCVEGSACIAPYNSIDHCTTLGLPP